MTTDINGFEIVRLADRFATSTIMDGVSGLCTGTSINVENYLHKTYWVSGGVSSNVVAIQVSPDGTNWFTSQSITGAVPPTSAIVSGAWQFTRAVVSTWDSEHVTVKLNGMAP